MLLNFGVVDILLNTKLILSQYYKTKGYLKNNVLDMTHPQLLHSKHKGCLTVLQVNTTNLGRTAMKLSITP